MNKISKSLITIIEARNKKYSSDSLKLETTVNEAGPYRGELISIKGFEATKVICSMHLLLEPMIGTIKPISADEVWISLNKF